MSSSPLAGKTALVTGAARGIGYAIAARLATDGARVAVLDLDTAVAKEAAERIGPSALALTADVTVAGEVEAAVRQVDAAFGRLDILVNNAGITGRSFPIWELSDEDWRRVIDVDLTSVFYCCRSAVRVMLEQGSGRIVNIASIAGRTGSKANSAYAASKAAVVRFTETLAEEVRGTRIDVNAVAPGALNTRLLDEVLAAGPEKVGKAFYERSLKQKADGGAPLEKGAALCAFLLSSESDGITGKLLSAVWDPWAELPARLAEIEKSDIYTLRRIVPKDRGKDWGDS